MDEEFKKKIIESLKKGGFPTELKVGKVLDERDWFNISNYIYVDKDKKISREIDFFCIKQSDSNDYTKVRFEAHLIIEVKKSEKPWVFFTQKNVNEFDDENINHDKFSSISYQNINYLIWDRIYAGFPTESCKFKSSSYAEAFRDSEISNIYKAIESVTKACYHFRTTNEIERHRKKPEDLFANDLYEVIDQQKPSLIKVFIPLVVVDSILVKAQLDSNIELAVEEASYIPYTSYYISEYNVEASLIVNVITLEYLPIFLKDIEDWIELKTNGLKQVRENNQHFR